MRPGIGWVGVATTASAVVVGKGVGVLTRGAAVAVAEGTTPAVAATSPLVAIGEAAGGDAAGGVCDVWQPRSRPASKTDDKRVRTRVVSIVEPLSFTGYERGTVEQFSRKRK
jgi:hypothetical protein